MSGWVKRPYVAATDEDFVLHAWITSYMWSRYGRARHAGGTDRTHDGERAFWLAHRQPVLDLIRRCDVEVVCDPGRIMATDDGPPIFWAFWAHEADTVHYVFVKRSVNEQGLGEDIVRDMLGDRLTRPQAHTFELVELNKLIRVPLWYPDFTYFARAA